MTASSSGAGDRDDRRDLRVAERRVDDRRLARDRTRVRRAGERARRAEHRDAVPGGGRVDDHEVVGRRARGAAVELRELPELADGEQLAQPRRRRREEPEQAAAAQQPGGGATAAGRAGTPPSPARGRRRRGTGRARLGLRRAVAGVRCVEHPGDIGAPRDLGHHGPAPAARGLQPDRRRDRRLAHAALPGDDDEAVGEQTLHLRSRVRVAIRRARNPANPPNGWVVGA